MRWRAMGGPLVLAVWQFAPMTTQQDSAGRVRLSFGFGGGRAESTAVNCAGDVIGSARAPYTNIGVKADFWPTDRLRVTGFTADRNIGDSVETSGSSQWLSTPGTTGRSGFQVAYEGQRFGLGLGSVGASNAIGEPNEGSLYLRIGNIDALHFRTDYNDPSPMFGSLGTFRVGMEQNTGHVRGPSWFFGLALCHFCGDHADYSMFGEVGVPVRGPLAITAQGLLGSGYSGTTWSGGVGLRASF